MERMVTNVHQQFGTQLFALICKKVKHQDYCHDILQELYIRIMEKSDKIEQAKNVRSYLLRMADNAVTDHFRKKENRPNNEFSEDILLIDKSPADDSSLRLADCCLRPMIDSLEPIYREILVMTELEGMSHKAYAKKAGISLTNAKTRAQRARQKLKQIILNCCTYEFDKYGSIVSAEKKCCNSR